jgi:hypothetical protein
VKNGRYKKGLYLNVETAQLMRVLYVPKDFTWTEATGRVERPAHYVVIQVDLDRPRSMSHEFQRLTPELWANLKTLVQVAARWRRLERKAERDAS